MDNTKVATIHDAKRAMFEKLAKSYMDMAPILKSFGHMLPEANLHEFSNEGMGALRKMFAGRLINSPEGADAAGAAAKAFSPMRDLARRVDPKSITEGGAAGGVIGAGIGAIEGTTHEEETPLGTKKTVDEGLKGRLKNIASGAISGATIGGLGKGMANMKPGIPSAMEAYSKGKLTDDAISKAIAGAMERRPADIKRMLEESVSELRGLDDAKHFVARAPVSDATLRKFEELGRGANPGRYEGWGGRANRMQDMVSDMWGRVTGRVDPSRARINDIVEAISKDPKAVELFGNAPVDGSFEDKVKFVNELPHLLRSNKANAPDARMVSILNKAKGIGSLRDAANPTGTSSYGLGGLLGTLAGAGTGLALAGTGPLGLLAAPAFGLLGGAGGMGMAHLSKKSPAATALGTVGALATPILGPLAPFAGAGVGGFIDRAAGFGMHKGPGASGLVSLDGGARRGYPRRAAEALSESVFNNADGGIGLEHLNSLSKDELLQQALSGARVTPKNPDEAWLAKMLEGHLPEDQYQNYF